MEGVEDNDTSQSQPEAAVAAEPTAAANPAPPVPVAPSHPDLRFVLIWTAVAFAIRAIWALWLHPIFANLSSDMGFSFGSAVAFANPRHVFDKWDVVKPRAMGVVGALIFRQFGQGELGKQVWGLLQITLSTVTLPLAFLGTRRFFGRRSARIALVILALDALSISFASFLMVETYAMFCLALAFALLAPERPLLSFLSGVALGLAGLFKPQVLPVTAFWCLLLFFWPGGPGRSFLGWLTAHRRISAVLLGAGVLAVVTPEAIAVSKLVGRPTLLSAYSGQNFYIGHCNVTLMTMAGPDRVFSFGVPKVYERQEPWPDVTFHVSILDSAFYFHEGMKCWRQSFWGTVLWSIEQLADVFSGWPGSTIDPFPIPGGWGSLPRYFSIILEYLFVPLGLAGLWRRRRELGSWIGFGAPLGSIWALALIFSGDPRYREPFDIFLVAGASGGLAQIYDRWRIPVLEWLATRLSRTATASAGDSPPPQSS